MTSFSRVGMLVAVAVLTVGVLAGTAEANHSWDGIHWPRTGSTVTVKLGNNVSYAWNTYLATASNDWSKSSVLDTVVMRGQTNPKNCRPTLGRVEVCSNRYGANGWLGLASVWITSDLHLTQATVKLNDTYFNTPTYNTPAWRRFVACQEVGHTFGLDHQDEDFYNLNLGTCMDYTMDVTGLASTNGTLDNEHPNQHDYDELEAIYAHLDGGTAVGSTVPGSVGSNTNDVDTSNPTAWGKKIRTSSDKRASLYERDLGKGNKMITFVIWSQFDVTE